MIKRIEQLEVLDILACGGQSRVYLARLGLSKVVLKRHFRPEDRLREYCTLASIRHTNITRLLGLYFYENADCLVLEYGGAYNLRMLLNHLALTAFHVDFRVIDYLAWVLFEVLAYLHPLGFFHNDLSPSNILLDACGDLKIADFGAASRVSKSSANLIFGKLDYMAPELLAGFAGHAGSDIYAIAIILVELITGELWEHKKPEESFSLLQDCLGASRPELLAWLPLALAKDPKLRPQCLPKYLSGSSDSVWARTELASMLRMLPAGTGEKAQIW